MTDEQDFGNLLQDAREKSLALRQARQDTDSRSFLKRPSCEWTRADYSEVMAYIRLASADVLLYALSEEYFSAQGRTRLAEKAREARETAEAQANAMEDRMGKVFPL